MNQDEATRLARDMEERRRSDGLPTGKVALSMAHDPTDFEETVVSRWKVDDVGQPVGLFIELTMFDDDPVEAFLPWRSVFVVAPIMPRGDDE